MADEPKSNDPEKPVTSKSIAEMMANAGIVPSVAARWFAPQKGVLRSAAAQRAMLAGAEAQLASTRKSIAELAQFNASIPKPSLNFAEQLKRDLASMSIRSGLPPELDHPPIKIKPAGDVMRERADETNEKLGLLIHIVEEMVEAQQTAVTTQQSTLTELKTGNKGNRRVFIVTLVSLLVLTPGSVLGLYHEFFNHSTPPARTPIVHPQPAQPKHLRGLNV